MPSSVIGLSKPVKQNVNLIESIVESVFAYLPSRVVMSGWLLLV